MTTSPIWSPLDDDTADLLSVLADPSPTIGADFSVAVDLYMSKCRREGSCLVREVKRYGEVRVGRHRMSAHRAVHIVKIGPIPLGHVVRHKCDRTQCVEPTHLETGTESQNLRDAYDRKRKRHVGKKGSDNGTAILNDHLVAMLRREARTGLTLRTLAEAHSLPYSTVYRAVRGDSWAHVSEPPVASTYSWSHRNPRRVNDEMEQRAIHLVATGLTCEEVGSALGLASMTVHRIVQRNREAS